MSATGGPVKEVAIRGRIFKVAADAQVSRKLGGYENEIAMNGDGTRRIVKTLVPWSFNDLNIVVDDLRGDQEFLQSVANGSDDVDIAVTLVTDEVYQGAGIVTSELVFNTQQSTCSVSLSGGGTLDKQ